MFYKLFNYFLNVHSNESNKELRKLLCAKSEHNRVLVARVPCEKKKEE